MEMWICSDCLCILCWFELSSEMPISSFPESSGIISNPLANSHYFLFLPDFVIPDSLKNFPEGPRSPKISSVSFFPHFKPWIFTPLGNGDTTSPGLWFLCEHFWQGRFDSSPPPFPFISSSSSSIPPHPNPRCPFQPRSPKESLEITNWNKLHSNSKQAQKRPHWCQVLDKYWAWRRLGFFLGFLLPLGIPGILFFYFHTTSFSFFSLLFFLVSWNRFPAPDHGVHCIHHLVTWSQAEICLKSCLEQTNLAPDIYFSWYKKRC